MPNIVQFSYFFKIGTHSGLLHCLSLVVTPPPHVRLQSVQCVHVDQLPSIGDGPFCPNSTHSPLLHHYNNVSICRLIKYWNAVSIYINVVPISYYNYIQFNLLKTSVLITKLFLQVPGFYISRFPELCLLNITQFQNKC